MHLDTDSAALNDGKSNFELKNPEDVEIKSEIFLEANERSRWGLLLKNRIGNLLTLSLYIIFKVTSL
jgi:hypothetical protein